MWNCTALFFISCIVEAHTVKSKLFRSVKAAAGLKTIESADSRLRFLRYGDSVHMQILSSAVCFQPTVVS